MVNNNGYNQYPSADTNGHGHCSAESSEAVRVKVTNPTSKAAYAGISMIVLQGLTLLPGHLMFLSQGGWHFLHDWGHREMQ